MADSIRRDFLDPAVLARLGALPLNSRRPVQGTVAGRHRSPHRGSSVEFAEYRKYVPGDDIRRLDWRAYARSDRFYIKEFEAETNLRLCSVVDASGSMNYAASDQLSKLDYARRLVGSLGYIALQQGDAVGLTVVSEQNPVNIPARRRPSHLQMINDRLGEIIAAGPSQLSLTLHELAERLRPRAMVVVVSDFFVEVDSLEGAFQHLRFRKHDVVAFQLLAPQEILFEFDRSTRFVDLEGGAPIVADPQSIARRYRDAFARHAQDMSQLAAKADIDFWPVQTDRSYDEILADFLLGRAQKGARP